MKKTLQRFTIAGTQVYVAQNPQNTEHPHFVFATLSDALAYLLGK